MPITAYYFTEMVEGQVPSVPFDQIPQADVIVVLGGTSNRGIPNTVLPEENTGSRMLMAARLYKAGKAPYIIASEGVKYVFHTGGFRWRVEDMRDLLIEYGVPEGRIIIENTARTTSQNAVLVSEIMKDKGFKKAILTTSAYHIRRASMLFEKEGVDIFPVPSSYHAEPINKDILSFIPAAHALEQTTRMIKELVGQRILF